MPPRRGDDGRFGTNQHVIDKVILRVLSSSLMVHRLEEIGKQVTPGNVAYYAILNTRSGRRSQGGSRNDVLGAGTQLDGKSSVLSMQEEIGYDPETGESVCLGDLLGTSRNDPAMAAGRNLDWAAFIDSHDYRYGVILSDLVKGKMYKDSAQSCGVGSSRIHELKGRMADELREYLGADALADVLREPAGEADLRAHRERAACHAERSRQHWPRRAVAILLSRFRLNPAHRMQFNSLSLLAVPRSQSKTRKPRTLMCPCRRHPLHSRFNEARSPSGEARIVCASSP